MTCRFTFQPQLNDRTPTASNQFRLVRILNVFQECEMVRETSQWEREEMEKVVSERKKKPLLCQIRRKMA